MDFSVVIPVYNEEGDIVSRYHKLRSIFPGQFNNYELVYVDNASTDSGLEILRKLKKETDHLKVIVLDKNYGKPAAFAIGFTYASGDIILTVDTDFKLVPDDLLRIISELKANDAVLCRMNNRYFMQVLRRILFTDNYTVWYLAGYRRKCLEALKLYKGFYNFIPELLEIYGCTVKEIYTKELLDINSKIRYGIPGVLKYIYGFFVIKWMKANKLRYRIVK